MIRADKMPQIREIAAQVEESLLAVAVGPERFREPGTVRWAVAAQGEQRQQPLPFARPERRQRGPVTALSRETAKQLKIKFVWPAFGLYG